MKDLYCCVVARTSKMKISCRRLADYVKKFHQKACRTCSTIILPHSTNQITDLCRCHGRCSRHFLNSPVLFHSKRESVELWMHAKIAKHEMSLRLWLLECSVTS